MAKKEQVEEAKLSVEATEEKAINNYRANSIKKKKRVTTFYHQNVYRARRTIMLIGPFI